MQSLGARSAREELEYIRRTLDAAGNFTAVSGTGLVIEGAIGMLAVWVNFRVTGAPWHTPERPAAALAAWAAALVAAVAAGVVAALRKSRATGQVVWWPLVRKVLWGLCPALLLGGILTLALIRAGQLEVLPAVWLGCYGAAVTAGGVVSVPAVRWMGAGFLALSAVAAWAPPSTGLIWMALGFGVLHLVFGCYIARRHDG